MACAGCDHNYVERYVGLAGWSCEGMLASQVCSQVVFVLFLHREKRALGDRTREALGFVFEMS